MSTENQSKREDITLRERMATLEAENAFNRETLSEVSTTLKEVVRTQHILANQKGEIEKILQITESNQTEIHALQNQMLLISTTSDNQKEGMDALKKRVIELEKNVADNRHFVNTVTKVLTITVGPVIVLFLAQLFGLK